MAVTGWKGATSARTFLAKFDRAHYLRLCGEEFTAGASVVAVHVLRYCDSTFFVSNVSVFKI